MSSTAETSSRVPAAGGTYFQPPVAAVMVPPPNAAVSELADHSMSGAWIVAVFDWTMVRIGSRDCDANRFVVCVSTANAAPVSAV